MKTIFVEPIGREVPAIASVCWRCNGHGTHTNPAIDGHGISSEEWNGPDWDDESREAYMSGAYDVRCEECGGERVTWEPDLSSLSRTERRTLRAWDREQAEDRRVAAEESRMRAMGIQF